MLPPDILPVTLAIPLMLILPPDMLPVTSKLVNVPTLVIFG